MGGGTINLVQAADTTAPAQVNAEQKAEKAAAPLTADELKKQLDKAGIKAGNVENSANVISIGTKSSVTFDKYYGDANHDGKIDVSGIGPWNAIAIGQSATVHNSANAIGIGGGAGGGETVVDNSVGAVGIGTHTQIKDSDQAVTYGIDSQVTGSAGAVSYGGHSSIENSKLGTSVGYGSSLKNSPSSVALGDFSSVTDSTQSAAIGMYSQVYKKSTNSVALGAFSTVNGESGVISVGHKASDIYPLDSTGKTTYGSDLFRRITNVAEGKDAHDAATVGQVENGYVAYDKDGDTVDKKSVSLGGVNGSGTELKNVSGITFKGTNNNMILTGTAGGKAQVKNSGNSIVLSTLGGGAGQNRPQTTISDTNEAISIGNSNTVTVDKNSDFYKNNQPYWFNGNVAVGTQVELTNAGESVGLGSSTEIKDSIASTAVGYASSVKKSTFSAGFGDHSKVESGTYSTAIGAYSEVKNAIGSVALGAHTSVDGQDNVVSVGNAASGSYKRIVNMADGIDAHDAVTVGQIENGYVAYDKNKDASVIPGSVTFKGTTQKVNDKDVNIGTKLNNVNDISFNVPVYERIDDKDAPKADPSIGSYELKTDGSTLTGYESRSLASTGLLPGKVSGDNGKGNNIALGRTTSIDGAHAGAIAVGKDATVVFDDKFSKEPFKGTESQTDSISIGTRTKNYNSYSGIALGASSGTWQSNWATALGTDSHVDNSYYGTAAGVFAKVENSPEGLALGRSAYVKNAEGSVALGSQSVADEKDVVSVGHTADDLRRDGKPYGDTLVRRITNVADGEDPHDAVTLNQLNDVKATAEKGFTVAIAQPNGEKDQTHTYAPGETVTIAGKNDNILAGVDNKGVVNVSLNDKIKVKSVTTDDVVLGGNSFAQAGIKAGYAEGATDDTWSLALGEESSIVDDYGNARSNSVAVGYGANVQQDNSTAVGTNARNNGNFSTSVGEDATGAGDYATALGGLTYAYKNGTAVGTHALAEENSVALGADSTAKDSGVVSVGHAKGDTYTAFDDNGDLTEKTYGDDLNRKIVHVADGTDDHDVATYGQVKGAIGLVGRNGNDDTNLAVGKDSFTTAYYDQEAKKYVNANNTALGVKANISTSSSQNSTAVGNNARIDNGTNATAIGQNSFVGTDNGTAIGQGATVAFEAGNQGSVALGQGSAVSWGDHKDADTNGVVSVGKTGAFQRRIINVADGVVEEGSHDAVTGGQLYTTNQAIGDVSKLEKAGFVDKDDEPIDNVTDAVIKNKTNIQGNTTNINRLSSKFDDFARAGVVVSIDDNAKYPANQNSLQLGNQASATGKDSVALGYSAKTNGFDNSTAIGAASQTNGKNTVALGTKVNIFGDNTVVIGANSEAFDSGDLQKDNRGNNTVIGTGASVDHVDNAIALGAGSIANEANTVSVGSAENKRRITNVADGVAATDVATVGQISKITGTDTVKGAVVQYDKTADGKNTDYSSVTLKGDNGTALKNVSDIELGGKSFVKSGLVPGEVNGKSYATAIGNGASVQDGYGTALGAGAKSVGSQSTAIGAKAQTSGSMNSTAVGGNSQANASGATAVGAYSSVSYTSENGSAFGANSHVYAKNGTALGNGSWAYGDDSVALGYNSRTQNDEKGVVSVGDTSSNLTRKIINVKDGTLAENSHDAVTGGQLFAEQEARIKADQVFKDKFTAYEAAGIVPGKVNGSSKATALGNGSSATAEATTALGANANAGDGTTNPRYATAVGANSTALSEGATAIGSGATVQTFGKENYKAFYGTALGTNATVEEENGTALGAATSVTAKNAVALGKDSVADEENTVSVGRKEGFDGVDTIPGIQRRITNVAAGDFANDYDAVTTGQLKASGIVPGFISAGKDSQSVAISANARLLGNDTVLIGGNSDDKENGYYNAITADKAVVIGQNIKATSNSVALGYGTNATGDSSVALGKDAKATIAQATAIGAGSVADEYNTVSVGSKGHERKITNVADGVNDFDAVNKKQLNAVDSKVTGLSDSAVQYDKNEDGTTNYGSITFKGAGEDVGTNLKNIGTITAANGWFYLNSNGKVSTYDLALSDGGEYNSFKDAGLVAGKVTAPASYNTFDNLVIGSGAKIDNMDTENGFAKQNTAVGNKAQILPGWEWGEDSEGKVTVERANSVSGSSAFGAGAQVTGNNSSAYGSSANVVNDLGVAIGYKATAGKSGSKDDDGRATAVGAASNAGGNSSTALGYYAQATVDKGTAVGANTSLGYGTEGSVALGANSKVDQADLLKDKDGKVTETNGVVSVGDSNYGTNSKYSFQRRIINVADGVNKFDAVNKGQLDAVDTKVTGLSDSAVQYDKTTDGKVNTNSVTFKGEKGTTLNNVKDIVITDEVPSYPGADPDDTKLVNLSFRDAGLLPGTIDTAGAEKSTALGKNSSISGSSTGSTVVGYGANVYGGVQDATAIGRGASIGNNSLLNGSVALGAGSSVSSSAAGLPDIINSDDHGVVSVGNSSPYNGFTRRIINVTDGRVMEGSHDAVTGQQLFAEQEARKSSDQVFTYKFAAYEKSGVVAGETFGENSLALGKDSLAGSNAIALGQHAQSVNNGAAVGQSATANGDKSLALGNSAVVTGAGVNSVALGNNSFADEANVVSVGGRGVTRKIVNVADGKVEKDSHDAVNGGQLYAVDSKVTGLSNNAVQYDTNADGTPNYDSVTFKGANGTVLNNVADIALPAYKGHNSTFVGSGFVNGIVYDPDSQWDENGAQKANSMAAGSLSNVRGTNGLAVGPGASVGDTGTTIANGTAVGVNSGVKGQNGTAVGEEATVAGDNGAAFGYQAKADIDSTAIGTNASAGYNGAGEAVAIGKEANVQYKQGVALGNNTEIMAEQGTALGYNANVTWNGKNSVALGAGSIANEEDVVSVGRAAGQGGNVSNPAITRRIVNVADGKDLTDAATVGQLQKAAGESKTEVKSKDNKNIEVVTSKAEEDGHMIYTVGLNNNLDLTNDGSIAFGTTGLKLDGQGLTINKVTYVSDAGLNAGGKAITNVGTPGNDTDAANKKYVDDSIKNAGISKDPSGDVTIGGTEGAGKVTVNKDGSASISGTKGNGFIANADGSNTVSGNTNFTGNVTINSQQIATGADVSGIQKQIGYDETTKTYTKIGNGAATVIDGINKNTAAIQTNKDNIGATGDNGALKLKNGEKTIEAGINKNTADIAHNAAAIQQNQDNITALDGAVSELDTRVDRVGAGAAALAALHPLDYDPANKWDFAAGYGHYKGANAVSVGTYYRPNENTMFSVGGSFGGGENMVNAGVSFKLGGGSGVTTSRTAMAAEINSLKDSNKALADNNKVLTDKVAAQDKKLADYDQKMKDMEAKLEALLKAQKQ